MFGRSKHVGCGPYQGEFYHALGGGKSIAIAGAEAYETARALPGVLPRS